MSRIITLIVWAIAAIAAEAQTNRLCEGDLLFCISKESNGITDVTQGIEGKLIDHVAIVHIANDTVYALEAIHNGVCINPIDSFLHRRDSLVLVGRLRDTANVSNSVQRALKYIGRPYDFMFMPDDNEIYCSELVQKTYRNANGELIFHTIPMSFHDKTGTVIPYWKDYYARKGRAVPEGEPGSNPGDLSRSDKLDILFRYY